MIYDLVTCFVIGFMTLAVGAIVAAGIWIIYNLIRDIKEDK